MPQDAAWLLKIFKQFIYFQQEQGNPYSGDEYWLSIIQDLFDAYKRLKGYDTDLIVNNLMPLVTLSPSSADICIDEVVHDPSQESM